MKFEERIKNKKVMLVAHRGTCGGNIPCNSIEAFQIALNHGADVIELDVEKSKDGVLFIQHPGMEYVHLGMKESLKEFNSDDIKQMYLLNQDLTKTQYHIPTLREALLFLKDKCIVNIDKFWENPKEITELVDELGMAEQVIIKTEAKEAYLKAIGVSTYEGILLPDLSIYKDSTGVPKFRGIPNARLTVSHDAGVAVAVVVIE